MSKFKDIFSFLKKRKRLLEKYQKAQAEVDKIEKDLKELEKPFFECAVDIEKYRKLFEKYVISFKDDKEFYIVKDIHLTEDYQGNPFYDAIYQYIRKDDSGNVIKESQSNLSLRKFLHLLDNPNCELKELESK